jgi:phenylpyruvate tautomerase PptA (4-oxalocrotonate tautomerase family)
MPNILVKIPQGAFPPEQRAALMRKITEAASTVEQIPDHPKHRFTCWVAIDEVASSNWTCGGIDVSMQMLPCIAIAFVPAGVLDAAARKQYVELMHAAFKEALPGTEQRQLVSSIIVQDVADGTWGANGMLWHLPDFAKAAGYAHRQQ